MDRRVFFKNYEDRKLFFRAIGYHNQVLRTNILLARCIGTSRSMIEKYKSGTLTLPESRFLILLEKVPEPLRNTFAMQISYKDGHWGRAKGGRITYAKHGEIFNRGRMLAVLKRAERINAQFRDVALDRDLCEFIGAFIGDGHIGKYSNSYILQITGDSCLDYDYYHHKLIPIAQKIFPEVMPRIYIKDNTIRLTFYSKALIRVFHERFFFPLGKKCYTVSIPKEVVHSSIHHISATLRGIFDTDGYVFFDKRKFYKNQYPRIGLHLKNKELTKQIYRLLCTFDIDAGIVKDYEKIQINGKKNVNEFIKKIGFSNERHLTKIRKISPRGDLHPRPAAFCRA